MGAQFWWFYDVLFLSTALGIFYHAVQKGFRQEILNTICFLVAVVVSVGGAWFLSLPIYGGLFQERITVTLTRAIESEHFDIFENASEVLALNATEGEETPDAEGLRRIGEKAVSGEECPEWFVETMGNVTESLISRWYAPHSEIPLASYFAGNLPAFYQFLNTWELSPEDGAKILEAIYYRPAYLKLMKLVSILSFLLVMWIVFSVISSMMGDSEEQRPVTGKSRISAIPLGLIEATGTLLILTVIIRLTVALTDGQMLLFNQETMNHTILFRYVYHFIVKCLAV